MYRLSKNEHFIDNNTKRENLRSENKIKFDCPFTRIAKIRKVHSIGELSCGIVSKFNITGQKTKRDLSIS